VYDAISSTLFAKQSSNKETVQLACDTSLSQLASKKLVIQKCNEDGETRLEVTDLGTAAYKGSAASVNSYTLILIILRLSHLYSLTCLLPTQAV